MRLLMAFTKWWHSTYFPVCSWLDLHSQHKFSSFKMQCRKLEHWVLFLYCGIQIPAVELSWIAESFNMDFGSSRKYFFVWEFFDIFKFEPLEKQTRQISPGASCPHGFAFQGSCCWSRCQGQGGFLGDSRKCGTSLPSVAEWGMERRNKFLQYEWENTGTADCPGRWWLPHPCSIQGVISISV